MRLTAIHKPSDELIEIFGVREIVEADGIYYISGENDPRSITMKPLTVMHNGDILFKAYRIELADRLYYNIELFR